MHTPQRYIHPDLEKRYGTHGTGVFALQPIHAGITIIQEAPCILPNNIFCSDYPTYICQSIQQLLLNHQEDFLNLTPFELDEYALAYIQYDKVRDAHKT